jgi:hypothetical protein
MTAPTGERATPIPALHLAIRFLLELALVASVAYWGWHVGDDGPRGLLLAILAVAVFAALWGLFGTPGDPSRGRAPVAVPGWARLLLELALIGVAAYCLWTAWSRAAAETLLTAFAVHYALTWERSRWLLRAPANPAEE